MQFSNAALTPPGLAVKLGAAEAPVSRTSLRAMFGKIYIMK
jgi:hypothetical protein